MKHFWIVVLIIPTLFMSACAGKMPQTADEFRQGAPTAFMGKLETYEVNRSAADIGKTFQKYAPKCLDVRIRTTSQTNMSYQVILAKYTPTVIVGEDRTELHLQEKHEKGVIAVYKEPEAGHYIMVVDATPIGKNKSRIDFYRPAIGNDTVVQAIKNWITGDNLGCPDMTK
jgi:hypothetical protein